MHHKPNSILFYPPLHRVTTLPSDSVLLAPFILVTNLTFTSFKTSPLLTLQERSLFSDSLCKQPPSWKFAILLDVDFCILKLMVKNKSPQSQQVKMITYLSPRVKDRMVLWFRAPCLIFLGLSDQLESGGSKLASPGCLTAGRLTVQHPGSSMWPGSLLPAGLGLFTWWSQHFNHSKRANLSAQVIFQPQPVSHWQNAIVQNESQSKWNNLMTNKWNITISKEKYNL